jgi:hypothetical protein
MLFPSFLGIMDKFIIMNVHDATPKPPKTILKISPFFLLGVWKKLLHVKKKRIIFNLKNLIFLKYNIINIKYKNNIK